MKDKEEFEKKKKKGSNGRERVSIDVVADRCLWRGDGMLNGNSRLSSFVKCCNESTFEFR